MELLLQNIADYLCAVIALIKDAVKRSGEDREYVNDLSVQDKNGDIKSGCAEITFVNLGDSIAQLNGMISLGKGDSVSFDGKKNEKDTSRYWVKFSDSVDMNLLIIRKSYVK